jgi:hypothetical protein
LVSSLLVCEAMRAISRGSMGAVGAVAGPDVPSEALSEVLSGVRPPLPLFQSARPLSSPWRLADNRRFSGDALALLPYPLSFLPPPSRRPSITLVAEPRRRCRTTRWSRSSKSIASRLPPLLPSQLPSRSPPRGSSQGPSLYRLPEGAPPSLPEEVSVSMLCSLWRRRDTRPRYACRQGLSPLPPLPLPSPLSPLPPLSPFSPLSRAL